MKKVTFERDPSGGFVDVNGEAECGMTFHVGAVLEPDSENPVLRLDMPLGLRGIQQILDAWKEHKS